MECPRECRLFVFTDDGFIHGTVIPCIESLMKASYLIERVSFEETILRFTIKTYLIQESLIEVISLIDLIHFDFSLAAWVCACLDIVRLEEKVVWREKSLCVCDVNNLCWLEARVLWIKRIAPVYIVTFSYVFDPRQIHGRCLNMRSSIG